MLIIMLHPCGYAHGRVLYPREQSMSVFVQMPMGMHMFVLMFPSIISPPLFNAGERGNENVYGYELFAHGNVYVHV